ncbi:MAG: PorV/PorQ family protein [Candidatus Neomarinimicrobiota bacterium]
MRYKKTLICIAIACVLFTTAHSDIVKKGQVGFRFLQNPISAEAIGRGGLGLVSFRNSNAVFWNPSGLGWLEGKMDFNASYTKGIADINYSAMVGAFNFGKYGVVALDFVGMDYGEFYGTRFAENTEGYIDVGTFQPSAFSAGMTYSQKVSDRFSYGVRLKYVYQDLGTALIGNRIDDTTSVIESKKYRHGEPAIDIGATYDFLSHGIRFGAVMRNFSREIKYETYKFPMPFAVGFSMTMRPFTFFDLPPQRHDLEVGFETEHPRDFKEKVKFGAEYCYHKLLILRTGYMCNYDERGLTFGMGICKEIDRFNFRLNYAYQDFGVFNSVHTLSLGVTK